MKQYIITQDQLNSVVNGYDDEVKKVLACLKPVERMTDEQIEKANCLRLTWTGYEDCEIGGAHEFARAIENHHFGSEE